MKKTLLYPLVSTVIFLFSVVINPAIAQNIIFEEGFESGTLDTDRWTANAAEDGGLVEPVRQLTDVPAIPRTGNYALAMGRSTDGRAAITNSLDLHLDLSGHEDVTLEFWLRRDFDETHEEDAIFLSADGGANFQKVLNLRPEDWGNRTYGLVVVDLGAAADFHGLELSDQVVVRFQQAGIDNFAGPSSYTADGFFIDDVVVKGAPEYATLPFTDGFEADKLGDSWRVADPFNSDLTAPEAEAQWGFIMPVRRLTDVPEIPRTGDYALAMGRASDGSAQGVNAIDLHLDLSGHEDVTLEFWLRSEYEETDEDDAIFLSVDGGKNFYEVLNLRPDDWGIGTYGLMVVDLGAAAAFEGLELSDQTVVRFQQRGIDDFVGTASYHADGFFIDDVVVKGAPEYATLPFTDGFEADKLGASWRVADPFNSDLTAPEAEAQWGFIMPVRTITDVSEIPRTGDYALAMGRASDGSEHGVNAIDLHLDLLGQEDVTLEFWLRSEYEETDEDDAIFFSNDGGLTFTEAFALEPGSREDGVYELVAFDLDSLAQELGLELTNQFVLRFQQRGIDDFVGTASYHADGFFIDDVRVTASAREGNQSPVLANIPDITEDELNTISFTATATDANEDDELQFSLGPDAPEGASIDAATGEFSWTPTEEQGPGNYVFSIIVSDGDLSDEQEITINTNEVNEAPVITSTPILTANVGELYQYEFTATDADLPANTLTYEAHDLPSWLSFEAATQMLSGTPDESMEGEDHTIRLQVTDGEETVVQEYNLRLQSPTGLFDKEQNSPFIVVYPNPTAGQVVIKLGESLWGEEVEVFIYDVAGSLLWNKKAGLDQSIENLSAYLQASREGVYLLQVKVRDQLTSLRIIRE